MLNSFSTEGEFKLYSTCKAAIICHVNLLFKRQTGLNEIFHNWVKNMRHGGCTEHRNKFHKLHICMFISYQQTKTGSCMMFCAHVFSWITKEYESNIDVVDFRKIPDIRGCINFSNNGFKFIISSDVLICYGYHL